MTALKDSFTSTGHKFFAHQEAMKNLQNGRGQPIVTHLMPTDICQHHCSFCSVATRDGNVLKLDDMIAYVDILRKYGLKAVIISGGGNPILYKCPKSGRNFNDLVGALHERGLEIGLITNGMPLREYEPPWWKQRGFISEEASRTSYGHPVRAARGFIPPPVKSRKSWATVTPETLDKLTWVRISMSGLDHDEKEVFVPDIDPEKTTLGMSYVGADIFEEPAHKQHGQVSTRADLVTLDRSRLHDRMFADRIDELATEIRHYVETYKPKYVRLLPDCLSPAQIDERCAIMQRMADAIDPNVVFVQYKPPQAPDKCFLGYIHPVLNSDGFVYPCDSVVLAAAEVAYRHGTQEHKFANPWRVCHWSEVARIYDEPVRSLIKEPHESCRGCVFWKSNAILEGVVNGTVEPTPPTETPTHANFV